MNKRTKIQGPFTFGFCAVGGGCNSKVTSTEIDVIKEYFIAGVKERERRREGMRGEGDREGR